MTMTTRQQTHTERIATLARAVRDLAEAGQATRNAWDGEARSAIADAAVAISRDISSRLEVEGASHD